MSNESKKSGKHRTQGPKLSVADVRFCKALMAGKSQYEAFVEAYSAKETREATDKAASRRVRVREIRDYLRELQHRATTSAQVDADRLVEGLARIAFANRGDLFDKHGRLLPQDQWPADVAATVEGVESEDVFETVSETVSEGGKSKRKELRGYLRKVKTAQRLPAFRLLAEILRLVGRDADAETMMTEIGQLRKQIEELKATGGDGSDGGDSHAEPG
jgi:Terminase small subunit